MLIIRCDADADILYINKHGALCDIQFRKTKWGLALCVHFNGHGSNNWLDNTSKL